MRTARTFLFFAAIAACLGVAAPVAMAKDIVVGQVAPFGGPLAVSGRDFNLGAMIGFDEINAAGGMGVRRKTWTGLCRDSQARPVFDGTERAKRDLDAFFVIPANVGVKNLNELVDRDVLPVPGIKQLCLQSPKETLAGGVVR